MKTEKNILIAFILNLGFSIFEFFGGIFSGSVAIISDSIHDIGDAISIGLAFSLEKKSKKQPDKNYTYGYQRFSVIGSVITTLILIVGSVFVIMGAINRIINPTEIKYNTMIVFAIIGVCVNFVAALFTHGEGSLNQRAVNLHMLEDVLGWIIVLVGAIIMKFTDITLIDPIMSICVSLFILVNAIKTLKEAVDIFAFFLGAEDAFHLPIKNRGFGVADPVQQVSAPADPMTYRIWMIVMVIPDALFPQQLSQLFAGFGRVDRAAGVVGGVDHNTLGVGADSGSQSLKVNLEALGLGGNHHHFGSCVG